MRKLIVLKSLVDVVWIVTCIPATLLCLFLVIYMFVDPTVLDLFFSFDNSIMAFSAFTLQMFGLGYIILVLTTVYCVFLFRKTLRYFQQVKPFHEAVIANFYKIGYLLLGIGIVSLLLLFIGQLVFWSQFRIHLGISPYVMLICLGLFFMVLSEVFKVAKYAKEENDLTV